MKDFSRYQKPMLEAAKKALPVIEKYWQKNPEYWLKEDQEELATHADFEAETAISKYLMSHTDVKQIWGEETANGRENPPTGLYWAIDPIDGTHNFVSGIPFFSISLALVEDGKIHLGVVADPTRNKIYTSWQIKKIEDHTRRVKLLLLGYGYQADQAGQRLFDFCMRQGFEPRALGTSALMLALAATDPELAVVALGVRFFDIAGGIALVEKSGKKIKLVRQGGLYDIWVGERAFEILDQLGSTQQ